MNVPVKEQIMADCGDLCARYGVKRLGIFGSVARGEDTPGSDIDFYAEFADPTPLHMPDRYFGFINEAERRFGRPVQLLTPTMVRNPFLKRSMKRDLTIVHG
ncbi:MAG: nucleotidyltransferase family protein [Candidatus Hydrogenedentes bacterium]|nr:nucleotidyltransferase family protein [Candidatus Hydrogenedentota bacterium]